MFSTKTVFVLGAGASKPYGYPLGRDLIKDLTNLTGDLKPMLTVLGIEEHRFEEFRHALLRASPPSIDAFLAHRADLKELGKLLIAWQLLAKETANPHISSERDHWYARVLDRHYFEFDRVDFSNTVIVTFNYDLSLEQFLYQALCERYGVDSRAIAEHLESMQIIHLHGHLGDLEWQRPGGRTYGDPLTRESIRQAASGI